MHVHQTHTRAHTHAHTHTHIHTHTCTHTHTHTHTQAYTHTHKHTHAHKRTHTPGTWKTTMHIGDDTFIEQMINSDHAQGGQLHIYVELYFQSWDLWQV